MMTYGLIESCGREFEEPDRVYSGNSLYSFDRSREPHNTSTNSSSPWFPRLNKWVRR